MAQDPQTPPPPLDYASPVGYVSPTVPTPGRRRWLFWVFWLLIVFIVLIFLLRSPRSAVHGTQIPLSTFADDLAAGRIQLVTIEESLLLGQYVQPPAGSTTTRFQTEIPPGMGGDFEFVQWLLEQRGATEFRVESNPNLLISILIPLIPWLLIFGVVWLLVRKSRRTAPGSQLIISGPGRWIPDAPAMREGN